ncbi:MAG: phosphonate metabolism protein/1,5-bisphosphokinase (PRPP-forming) PhnN [Candidatus Thiodiazotropha sp.]|jgi:ribose 1,5-bisphosphokinase
MAELYYVIGPSGVGKDSLLNYARQHVGSNRAVMFAHRYITRPADAGGENHVSLSREEFISRAQMGCFAMQWHSHDTWYGIGIEINQWLEMGLKVVVNGSRAYLDNALQKYPRLIPVIISASPETLRQRLQERGRESMQEIEKRVIQAMALERTIDHPRMVKITNEGALANAGDCLIELIHNEEPVCV